MTEWSAESACSEADASTTGSADGWAIVSFSGALWWSWWQSAHCSARAAHCRLLLSHCSSSSGAASECRAKQKVACGGRLRDVGAAERSSMAEVKQACTAASERCSGNGQEEESPNDCIRRLHAGWIKATPCVMPGCMVVAARWTSGLDSNGMHYGVGLWQEFAERRSGGNTRRHVSSWRLQPALKPGVPVCLRWDGARCPEGVLPDPKTATAWRLTPSLCMYGRRAFTYGAVVPTQIHSVMSSCRACTSMQSPCTSVPHRHALLTQHNVALEADAVAMKGT